MRTDQDANPAELDEPEKNFVSQIREHGWFRTSVSADDEGPGFSYTTGFWLNLGFPEVITFSLKDEIAHDTFWHMYKALKNGELFTIGQPVETVFENLEAALVPVAERQFKDHLGWSRWFYGGNGFQCVQLVWPDRTGLFPWQPGYEANLVAAQPDLTDGNWAGLRRV
jgi:hypothetical protein